MPVLLPYDGSAVARAALCYLTDGRHRRWMDGRLILMLATGQRCVASRRLVEARCLVGRDITVSYRLIAHDIPGSLHRLAQSVSSPVFVSPLELSGTTAWFKDVAHAVLTGKFGPCIAVCELPRMAATRDQPEQVSYERPALRRLRSCASCVSWSSRSVADIRNRSPLEEL